MRNLRRTLDAYLIESHRYALLIARRCLKQLPLLRGAGNLPG
jgi:hypothetical protein